MAKNVEKEEAFTEMAEEMGDKADLDLERATIEHEFSSPWDDSDLVLVVEDQKLHVHRSILKMASPVFKAMLSSNFREKYANEIALPGKKVNEFVEFLRQIYPLLDGEITLKNIRYIYRLADEYQMTKVMKECRMAFFLLEKTRENAMDMLLLAEDIEAEEACQQCYDVLKKMTLNELKSLDGFSKLGGQSMHILLLPVIDQLQQEKERLQLCIKRILPELIGSLDVMMYLWCHEDNPYKMGGVPSTCPKHFLKSRSFRRDTLNVNYQYERIQCITCKGMFTQMALNARGYTFSTNAYLTENIVSVLEEMMYLTKTA